MVTWCPTKIWARSVQPFWRLLDANKQTDRQTNKPNLYIDYLRSNRDTSYKIIFDSLMVCSKLRNAGYKCFGFIQIDCLNCIVLLVLFNGFIDGKVNLSISWLTYLDRSISALGEQLMVRFDWLIDWMVDRKIDWLIILLIIELINGSMD